MSNWHSNFHILIIKSVSKGALHNYDPSQNCAKWVYLIYFYALEIGTFT